MRDLEITWPDGTARFSPQHSPIQLGRSSEAAVPLTEGSVSRRHLELVWGGSVWTVGDSSTHGTFDSEGRRLPPRWTISSDTVIRLGGAKGVQVTINLDADEANPSNGSGPGAGSLAGGLFSDNAGTPADSSPSEEEQRSPVASLFSDQAIAQPDIDLSAAARRQEPGFEEFPARERVGSTNSPDFAPSPSAWPSLGPAQQNQPSPGSGSGLLESDRSDGPGPPSSWDQEAPPPPPPGPEPDRDGPDLAIPGATGGHSAVRLGPNTTIIGDATLRLNLDGQDYSFVPGAEITVGRDPASLVRVDERHSLVSRKHLRISHRNGDWWLEDHSSKGTFIDHKRVKAPYKVEGAFVVQLGDDDAGTPLRIIASGEHRVARGFNPLVIGGLAVAALLPLIILAVLLTRTESASIEPDFASAKRSTVMLFGLDGGQGTGFFIDDNLILTNQHVAVLSPQMLVGVSRQTDEPAQIEYATELVANHPFLDIAVLRISNKATMTRSGPEISSDPVGNINLPSVVIGDSDNLTIGDEVFSTGFPDRLSITSTDDMGDLRLPPVAATSGEAASFTIWPGCSNPDFEAFIPADSPPGVACSAGGDVDKGVLRATFSSGQGASGSAVFHDNKVVAVVYAGDAEDSNKSLNVSTAAFAPWLEEIIDANP